MRLVRPGDIARIVDANAIEQVAAERGIELRPLGHTLLVGRCPFELEAVGRSLLVEPHRARFRCLTCWARGNVLGLVMLLDGVGFLAALEQLAARAGIDLDELRTSRGPAWRIRRSDVPAWALTPALR